MGRTRIHSDKRRRVHLDRDFAPGLLRYATGSTMTPVPPQKSFPTESEGVKLGSWVLCRDGSLWISAIPIRGLNRLQQGGRGFSMPIKRGSVDNILEDHAGTIWITR